MRALFLFSLLLAAGCLLPVSESRPTDGGTASGGALDAGRDAGGGVFDAGHDAGPFFATISVIELGFANAGNGGQGIEVNVDFSSRLPVREDQPGQPWGCKAWTSTGPWPLGADLGPVRFASQSDPALFPPQCAFVPSAGYLCVVAQGTGGVVNADLGPVPLTEGQRGQVESSASLSVSGAPFSSADRGRHLRLAGSTLGNDSLALTSWDNAAYVVTRDLFPISPGASASGVVRYATPRNFGADETLPASSRWWLLMGAGPNPFVNTPTLGPFQQGLLLDADQLSVSFGGRAELPGFSLSGLDPADGFALIFSTMDLWRVPFDGSPFTLACRYDYEGCEANTASLLELETTDGAPPADELAFPPVARVTTRVRCLVPDARSATVPPEYLALLGAAAPTRLKVTFAKVRVVEPGPQAVVLVGHGLRAIVLP